MKAAILCNGPSKNLFSSREGYDYVIGCNIPWYEDVDATVVLDVQVVRLWAKQPNLIKVPTYFSIDAWRETSALKKREFFDQFLISLIKPKYVYHSSGHNATEIAIKNGHKILDIYGCDSYFSEVALSYTRTFIKDGAVEDNDMKHIMGWRNRWDEIIKSNPSVTLNFIKEETV